jgi:hypothetical protein
MQSLPALAIFSPFMLQSIAYISSDMIQLESLLKLSKYTSETWPFKTPKQENVLAAQILSVLSNEAETNITELGANYM